MIMYSFYASAAINITASMLANILNSLTKKPNNKKYKPVSYIH